MLPFGCSDLAIEWLKWRLLQEPLSITELACEHLNSVLWTYSTVKVKSIAAVQCSQQFEAELKTSFLTIGLTHGLDAEYFVYS